MQVYTTKIDVSGVEPHSDGVVGIIQDAVERNMPFAMYRRTVNGTDFEDLLQMKKDSKYLAGHTASRGLNMTFPMISDPEKEFRGAICVVDDILYYGPKAIAIHDQRDAYRFTGDDFFYDGKFRDIVDEFLAAGYSLRRLDDLLTMEWSRMPPLKTSVPIGKDDFERK